MSTMKKLAFPLFGAAVLVATCIVGGSISASHAAQLDSDKATLAGIQDEVTQAKAGVDTAAEDTALEFSGAQRERVESDEAIIEDLANRALSWDDHAAYQEARASTMRAYGLTEDSAFMTAFLPPAPVNLDKQGNEYPYIDAAGLNSRAAGVTARLLGVDGSLYSYMALVDVESTSSDGLGTASNVATIFLTIDSDGLITSLTGYAATSAPATSK